MSTPAADFAKEGRLWRETGSVGQKGSFDRKGHDVVRINTEVEKIRKAARKDGKGDGNPSPQRRRSGKTKRGVKHRIQFRRKIPNISQKAGIISSR